MNGGKPETPRRLASVTIDDIAGVIVQAFRRQMLELLCVLDRRNFATLADDWRGDRGEWLRRFIRDD